MPDPVSIAATALTGAKVLFKASETICLFVRETREIGRSISALQRQGDSLARVLKNLSDALERPVLNAKENQELWSNVQSSVDACQLTINDLASNVEPLQVHGLSSALNQAKRTFKLGLNQEHIDRLISNMQTHSLNLQLALGTVNVYVSLMANARTNANANSIITASIPGTILQDQSVRFEHLERMLYALSRRMDQNAGRGAQPLELGPEDQNIRLVTLDQNTKLLRNSAMSVMSSNASMSMGSVLGGGASTITEPVKPTFEMVTEDSIQPSSRDPHQSTTGSELGVPLNMDSHVRINAWLQQDSALEEINERNFSSVKGSALDSLFDDGEIVPSATNSGNISQSREDQGSDDDLDVEVAEVVITKAHRCFQAANYDQAISLLQSGLSLAQTLRPAVRAKLDVHLLKSRYLRCCEIVGRLSEIEDGLLKMAQEPVDNDSDAQICSRVFYTLAVLHMKNNTFDAAQNHCRQALKRQRKSIGKAHPEYYGSLGLMSLILWAKGEKSEAQGFVGLIPKFRDGGSANFDFEGQLAYYQHGHQLRPSKTPDQETFLSGASPPEFSAPPTPPSLAQRPSSPDPHHTWAGQASHNVPPTGPDQVWDWPLKNSMGQPVDLKQDFDRPSEVDESSSLFGKVKRIRKVFGLGKSYDTPLEAEPASQIDLARPHSPTDKGPGGSDIQSSNRDK